MPRWTVYLPNYYASHIGLSLLAVVGASFSLVRLIDIAFDPLIGDRDQRDEHARSAASGRGWWRARRC